MACQRCFRVCRGWISVVTVVLILALALPGVGLGQGSSTATGISRTMNPAISVNGLFWGQVSRDFDAEAFNRIALQEAEAQFTAIVDPFWKANFTLAVHPAHAHVHLDEEQAEGGESGAGDPEAHAAEAEPRGYYLDVEEAYIDGRALPAGLALRLGIFYLPFGKHQPLHTHQFPFAVAPAAIQMYLGDHPLTEPGAWLAATVPLPWYSDLKVYGVNGNAEIFDSASRDLVWGGRWDNLWDVSENATVELGGSALTGPGGISAGESRRLNVFGADLTYKWVSGGRSQGPALTVGGEVLWPRPESSTGNPHGWYALAAYRFHRNWWFGVTHGRAETDGQPIGRQVGSFPVLAPTELTGGYTGSIQEYKANLIYAPSEFSALRFEVDYYEDQNGDHDDLRFILQWNFTIGSHPAHLY